MPNMFDVAPSMGVTGVYEVGGHVRDQLMGITSKDIDYAVEALSYQHMLDWVSATHVDVFVTKPEYATVRALLRKGEPRDYVLCRKDGAYSDARHPDTIERGTIFDDLARRDFTVNAIARNVETGEILDPHDGIYDLKNRRLVTVGDTFTRFNEDTLRIVRAIRFCSTKGFEPGPGVSNVLAGEDGHIEHWLLRLHDLPVHRRFEEIEKMMSHHAMRTMSFMKHYVSDLIRDAVFEDIWLQPRTKEKR